MNKEELNKALDEISSPTIDFFKNLRARILSCEISRGEALVELGNSDVATKGKEKKQIGQMLQPLRHLYINGHYDLFDKYFDEVFESIFKLEWLKAYEAKLDEIQNEIKNR